MGEAIVTSSGGSSGLRQKSITKAAYLNLSETDRNNPYIIWVISDAESTDFTNTYGTEMVTKVLCYEAYCKLSENEKMSENTLWVISDKTAEELGVSNVDTDSGSKFYNVAGTPSSTHYSKIEGIDYALNKESTNPISNMAVTSKFREIESALGGLKFGISETGGLTINYNPNMIPNGDDKPNSPLCLFKSAKLKIAEEPLIENGELIIPSGHKYIDFIVDTADGINNETHIYLDVEGMILDNTGNNSNGVTIDGESYGINIESAPDNVVITVDPISALLMYDVDATVNNIVLNVNKTGDKANNARLLYKWYKKTLGTGSGYTQIVGASGPVLDGSYLSSSIPKSVRVYCLIIADGQGVNAAPVMTNPVTIIIS